MQQVVRVHAVSAPVTKFRGLTYPHFLGCWPLFQLWRRFMCPRDRHLFDETWSLEAHYLVCDACQLMVHISSIETTWVGRGT